MSKFLKDLKFGLNKEMQLLPVLKDYLKDETIYKLENSNVFDFKGDNKFIELNSRNNNNDDSDLDSDSDSDSEDEVEVVIKYIKSDSDSDSDSEEV